MYISMRCVLRCIAAVCVVLLLVETGDGAQNDAWGWRRRRSDRRRRFWTRRRRKVVVAAQTACKPTHVVSLADSRDAAIASSHVYGTNTPVGAEIQHGDYKTGYKIIKVVDLGRDNLKAYVADKGNTRMIVFRGTNGVGQLLKQFNMGVSNAFTQDYDATINDGEKDVKVKVLTFTWNNLIKLEGDIIPLVKDASKKYILTGHSLGGAFASLFAIKHIAKPHGVSMFKNKDSCIITFGAPRMGDKAFADLHDLKISPTRKARFVYKRDIVPHVPVTIGNSDFIHHTREVWIATYHLLNLVDKKVAALISFFSKSSRQTEIWRVCKDQDTTECSNGIPWTYLVTDHGMHHYIGAIKDRVPKKFQDKNKKDHTSWAETWKCSNNK